MQHQWSDREGKGSTSREEYGDGLGKIILNISVNKRRLANSPVSHDDDLQVYISGCIVGKGEEGWWGLPIRVLGETDDVRLLESLAMVPSRSDASPMVLRWLSKRQV